MKSASMGTLLLVNTKSKQDPVHEDLYCVFDTNVMPSSSWTH